MVAPATRTTDRVACTTTSALLANEERSVVPRPDPRNASAGSVRVANHAGAAPNTTPVASASPNAKPKIRSDGAGANPGGPPPKPPPGPRPNPKRKPKDPRGGGGENGKKRRPWKARLHRRR